MERKIEYCFEAGNLKKLQTKFRKYLRLYIDKIEYEKLYEFPKTQLGDRYEVSIYYKSKTIQTIVVKGNQIYRLYDLIGELNGL